MWQLKIIVFPPPYFPLPSSQQFDHSFNDIPFPLLSLFLFLFLSLFFYFLVLPLSRSLINNLTNWLISELN